MSIFDHDGGKVSLLWVRDRPGLTPRIIFGLCIWVPFVRFGQSLAWTYFLALQTTLRENLPVGAGSEMAAGGRGSGVVQIWPHRSRFGSAFESHSSDLDKVCHERASWPCRQVCARLCPLVQNRRCPSEVKDRPNWTPQMTFRLGVLVSFIRFGQNLAWAWFLTMEVGLRKSFSFIAKSKWQRPLLRNIYEICHNLQTIQVTEQIISTHVFKGRKCNESIISVQQSQQQKFMSILIYHTIFCGRFGK